MTSSPCCQYDESCDERGTIVARGLLMCSRHAAQATHADDEDEREALHATPAQYRRWKMAGSP